MPREGLVPPTAIATTGDGGPLRELGAQPRGTGRLVVPWRGDTRHLPVSTLGWWTPLASVHTTYKTAHKATMLESPNPTSRGRAHGTVWLGGAGETGFGRDQKDTEPLRPPLLFSRVNVGVPALCWSRCHIVF